MNPTVIRIATTALLVALPSWSSATAGARQDQQPGSKADLILHNAVVWTVDAKDSTAQAVAVSGDKIIAVGDDQTVLKLRGPDTHVIDLKGRFVVPGFNDSHVHLASAARFLEFNIMTASNQAEFIQRLASAVRGIERGEWILGGYWGAYDQWSPDSPGGKKRPPFTPRMMLVQGMTEHNPVFIRKFDNSEFAANIAALKAVGLDPAKPEAPGVTFLRDSAGRFSGIMRGEGVERLFRDATTGTFSRQRRVNQTRNALDQIRRFGVTSISDMSDDQQLDIYRELHDDEKLTVRVHFRYPLDRWKELADKGVKVGSGDEWIRLGALKGHIDGIMGTSSARFLEPYANDPKNRGRWRRLMVDDEGNFVEGKFLQYMLDADKAGLQLSVHAIGDEANHLLLDYLEELEKKNGSRDRRFRLVHAQVMTPEDIRRLGKLGVIAEVQPFHLSDDMRWMEERIGSSRCRGAYAFESIRRAGGMLCFGSDWPGTSAAEYPIDPVRALHAAVMRQTLNGEPLDGWYPDERIDIRQAIRAHTYAGAYASFEEDIKGSIEVGKLADLAVLSDNLLKIEPRWIRHVQVHYTIVGGNIVYGRPD